MSVLTEYADDLTMVLGRREASVLIVVDQVEELFQNVESADASAFLNVLRRATERRGGRVFGLLTLRSDFLGSFQIHPSLSGVAFADLPLGQLPVENFPQVIEGPADRAGIVLEPGLVPSMIADARTDDALPLLAFTLREMYERCREQERLTLKAYREDLGGITGAVVRVVERIKTDTAWTPEISPMLRRAFLKLVRVNDEGQFTRQPCRWADVPDRAAPILEAFVKARLLSSSGDVVEVTHESLFRVWHELAGWLSESREFMLWKKNVLNQVKDWEAHDRSSLYLLSGARVAEARRWLASHADDFPDPEGEFLRESIAAEDRRIARERAQQEKLRWLARTLAAVAVAASILGVYAWIQRNEAGAKAKAALKAEANEKNQRLAAQEATKRATALAKIATSRQLAALSSMARDKRLDLSLILAVEALRAANTLEARNCLLNALRARPWLSSYLHVDEGSVSSVAFSPDGKILATGYEDGHGSGVVLWDAAGRNRLLDTALDVKEGYISAVAFSPDGKTIAAGYRARDGKGGIVLWDAASRQRLLDAPLRVKEGYVHSVAFSPDGKNIAAGYSLRGAGVVLWGAASRQRLFDAPLGVTDAQVTSVAFSPDGKTIAAGYRISFHAGGVVLWDAAGGKRLVDAPLDVKEGQVSSVAFSPDGKTIAAGHGFSTPGGGVALWDAATYKRLGDTPLDVKDGDVTSVAFRPDGNIVIAGYSVRGSGGVACCYATGRTRVDDASFAVTEGLVNSVAYSPDGKTIAAGYGTRRGVGGVVLWEVGGRDRPVDALLDVTEGDVSSVAFSPDRKTIAAGYRGGAGGGGVALWDAAGRNRLVDVPLRVTEGDVNSVAFSPDGKTIAAGYGESEDFSFAGSGGVVLWDAAGYRRLLDAPLDVKEGPVSSVAFSPDGKTIAAGYRAGGVVLWDAATFKRLGDAPLGVPEGSVWSVAFSPDGKTIAAGYDYAGGGGVVLWDAASRKRLMDPPLDIKEGDVISIAFSPDTKTLAAGYTGAIAASGVVLWDTNGRKRMVDAPLDVEEGRVVSVAFSPDGNTVTAGFRRLLKNGVVLWDAAGHGRLINVPLHVFEGLVSCVAFSPDGKTIAAGFGGPGSGVALCDLNPESWKSIAAQIANRNLTRDEWRQYFPDEAYRATFPDLPVPAETPR